MTLWSWLTGGNDLGSIDGRDNDPHWHRELERASERISLEALETDSAVARERVVHEAIIEQERAIHEAIIADRERRMAEINRRWAMKEALEQGKVSQHKRSA